MELMTMKPINPWVGMLTRPREGMNNTRLNVELKR